MEPALVDALVDDVAGEPGGLPLLSTALVDVWREREGSTLTLAAYERSGGVRGAVGRHADAAFRSLHEDERQVARRILLRLVTGGGSEALTRRRVSRAELDADSDERVARVLTILVERRLLVADDGSVELVHEALLEQWPRLKEWLEEDAQGRRLHLHLAQAASGWEASGREPGELYRGARLAAALEWADATGAQAAGLNRLEREFLEESRTAFARANRRLRALLAAAVVLLLAALVAGGVALAARGSAKRQATAAIAQRLGAQALSEQRLDRALLLARAGIALDDTEATRSDLLATLLRSPTALRVLHPGGSRVLDDALSPDGRVLAVRGDDGSVAFFDVGTGAAAARTWHGTAKVRDAGAIVLPVRDLAFSPDGRELAVGDTDVHGPTLALLDLASRHAHVVRTKGNAATADVAYAPDGRTIVTGEITLGRGPDYPEMLVRRRAADGAELRRSAPIEAGRLVGFAFEGRNLLVTSGDNRALLLDARTFRPVHSFGVGGSPAIAADGVTAAFGHDDGSVSILALRSGRIVTLGGRVPGRVSAVAFSPDRQLLASASDDGTIGIWDLATRTLRETYRGHSAAALGVVFGRDGSTLYSGAADGTEIAWDVGGLRRLGRPFRFSSSSCAATAVATSPDSAFFVTSAAPNRVTIWRAARPAAHRRASRPVRPGELPRVEPRRQACRVYRRRSPYRRLVGANASDCPPVRSIRRRWRRRCQLLARRPSPRHGRERRRPPGVGRPPRSQDRRRP